MKTPAGWMFAVILLLNILLIIPTRSEETEMLIGGSELIKLRQNVDAGQLDVLGCYHEAIKLEKEITQMYREIRAAKLSRIQRQSLKKSLKQMLMPISKRRQLNEKILKIKANNSEEIKLYQDELKKVMQENDAIVANAQEMLQSLLPEQKQAQKQEQMAEKLRENNLQFQEKNPQNNAEIKIRTQQLEQQFREQIAEVKNSLTEAIKEIEQAEKMIEHTIDKKQNEQTNKIKQAEKIAEKLKEAETAATAAITELTEKKENITGKIKRANNTIARISQALAITIAADKKLAAAEQQEPQKHTGEAVNKLQNAAKDMQDAAKSIQAASSLAEIFKGKLSSDQKIAQQQTLGRLARAEAGKFLDISRQMQGQNLKLKTEPLRECDLPAGIQNNFNNTGGLKLLKEGGIPAVWFYVNKWYILGPYDNKGRMNIQKVFPPESIIDLDANYLGKNNAKLKWVYDSFAQPMLSPTRNQDSYSIFYGFTELYFEESQDLWIAIGSDDRSDLWINGMPVWHSSNRLKFWRMNEGFRKVHFNQGLNKIVFRLENGWHCMGFSLMINTRAAK